MLTITLINAVRKSKLSHPHDKRERDKKGFTLLDFNFNFGLLMIIIKNNFSWRGECERVKKSECLKTNRNFNFVYIQMVTHMKDNWTQSGLLTYFPARNKGGRPKNKRTFSIN